MYEYAYICIFLNITCLDHLMLPIYVFNADHLALDTILLCSSLGESTTPASSFPLLPVVLYVGLRSYGLSFVQLARSLVSSLFTSHLGNHVGETLEK